MKTRKKASTARMKNTAPLKAVSFGKVTIAGVWGRKASGSMVVDLGGDQMLLLAHLASEAAREYHTLDLRNRTAKGRVYSLIVDVAHKKLSINRKGRGGSFRASSGHRP